MENGLSPQFQSYQGLHRVVTSKQRLQTHIRELLDWLSALPPEGHHSKHYNIRLLDTFFSDTLDEDVIEHIIALAFQKKMDIRILLLDPFSVFARSRAISLKQNSVYEVNCSLFMVYNALRIVAGKKAKGKLKHSDKFRNSSFLEELLFMIREINGSPALEIRFYNLLTEAPVYIFSEFLGKGLILHDQSAAHNPWLMFVDDITQEDDLYDYLSSNFDTIWNEDSIANPIPQNDVNTNINTKGVFISHGHNEAVTLKIRNFLKDDLNQHPILFEDSAKPGLTIVENLEIITRGCSRAIILLTKEDELKDGGIRARQNVIHELGYCQSLYGRNRVVLLLEEGVELPSNISGILHSKFIKSNVEMCYEFLRKNLL
ncbi:MAG: nucleotide-binding protein [Ignavibacteria bacterium]|jgi:hypothetical protein